MRSALRALRPALAAAVLATLALLPAPARAADDRFALDVRLAREAERFQSREADSLGLSFSTCTVGIVDCSFRVMDLPLQKTLRPTLEVFGQALTSERVFVPGASAGITRLTMQSPMIEMSGGIGLAIPLGIVDGTRGADFLVRYQGGVVIAAESGENFLQTSSVHFGFQRVGGVFDGSEMEVGYGHDDLFGTTWAAKRWSARMMLLTGIGRAPRAAAAADPRATAAAQAALLRHPVRAFLETVLQTDGRPGPDRIGIRMGVAFDAGAVLARAGGSAAR